MQQIIYDKSVATDTCPEQIPICYLCFLIMNEVLFSIYDPQANVLFLHYHAFLLLKICSLIVIISQIHVHRFHVWEWRHWILNNYCRTIIDLTNSLLVLLYHGLVCLVVVVILQGSSSHVCSLFISLNLFFSFIHSPNSSANKFNRLVVVLINIKNLLVL